MTFLTGSKLLIWIEKSQEPKGQLKAMLSRKSFLKMKDPKGMMQKLSNVYQCGHQS